MTGPRRDNDLVRPYVVTGGRSHTHTRFDLVSLVVTVGEPTPGVVEPGMSPEKRRLVALCRGGALSVAEISAHLELPVAVTKVLLEDLTESGHVAVRSPAPAIDTRPTTQLLQEVLDGLRALV